MERNCIRDTHYTKKKRGLIVMKDGKKRIAFIIPRLGKGGAERVVSILASKMAEDGHYIEVYTILSGEVNYPLSEKVKHIYFDRSDPIKLLQIIKRFLLLRSLIKRAKVDTVITFDRKYGIVASLFNGKRVIGSERNDPYSNMGKHSIEKYFRDIQYRLVDCVVFQTDYAKKYFSKKIQEKSVIIANPVYIKTAVDTKWNQNSKEIVAACRLTAQKNLPMMIDAFEQFDKKYPGYRLTIYGEGPLKNKLENILIQRKLQDKVRFAGYTDQIQEKMQNAVMYISTSDYEGISNSMLEAMALGIPVVCTDCPAGGAAMVIQDGINGYLSPVKDSVQFSKKMQCVIEQRQKTIRIAKKAKEVKNRFSVNEIVRQWLQIC